MSAEMGIGKRCMSAYLPQAKGVAEGTRGGVADHLAKSARVAGLNWVERLPATLMAYRTSIDFPAGFSPLSPLSRWDFARTMYSAPDGTEDICGDELEKRYKANMLTERLRGAARCSTGRTFSTTSAYAFRSPRFA